jgi:PAS domain S-box-containing protein
MVAVTVNGKFFSSNNDQQHWSIVRQFILIWAVLTLALAIALWSVYKAQEKSTLAYIRDEERQAIKAGSQFIVKELQELHDDLFYLRDKPALHDWLGHQSSLNMASLSADWVTFVKYRKRYDGIVFLNEKGQERIRVDQNQGLPVIVPERELQDKSRLDFVGQTLSLDRDNVYISPFDLAIEQNKIEQPIKPVIRFGTPVFDKNGQKRGIILLYYWGQRLIDRLRAISQQSIGSLWLLNAKGYWLTGPGPEDEWGFMYPDRKDKRFANDYAEAWASIIEHPERQQFMANGDLFTYCEILPKTLFGDILEDVVSGDERWILVARVPAEKLLTKNVLRARVLAFIALSLLSGVVSWFIAYYRTRRQQIEEDMIASEARFRNLVESAPDAFIIVNVEGRIVLVNAQAEKWFGYSRDELLNQPVELLVPERFHTSPPSYRQAYTDNPLARREVNDLYGRRKDGSDFPVEINLSPLETTKEKLVIHIIRDISARRQAEEELRASEIRFRGLLESAPDAIVIVNEKGCIVLVNALTEKWFGYARDELLDQPVELLMPERFRMHHQDYRQGYTKDPQVRPMGVGLDLFGRRKDGSDFPVEINLSPLKIGPELFIISIIRDITARKRSEQLQREVQAKYQDLVSNLRIGVYRHTPESGRFLEVNPAIVAMFEAESAEQLQKYPVVDLCRDAACWEVFMDKIKQQGFVDNEEIQLVTLKHREFSASVTAAMKTDSSGNTYYDGIIEDISERKETDRRIQQLNIALRERAMVLESINHELEAFSYSVSHDLRAPLRAVDGFSRILLDEYANRLDDTGQDRLRRVRAAAQRMAMLIDDLLKLSRITRSELKREDIDLSAIAAEVIDELRKQEPNRVVQCTIQPGLIAWGDGRLLHVVLDNLLGNAWKFTGKRADPQIEFGMQVQNDEPVYFVRDNGAGFDMAYAEKLFGAFQRLHGADEFPGIGIGLATVQRIIHKHGGRIWAESKVEQGAAFYFTLEAREVL